MLAVRLPSPVVLAHAVISRTRRTKAGRMQSLRWVEEGNFAETKVVSSAHVMQCEEDAHLRGGDFDCPNSDSTRRYRGLSRARRRGTVTEKEEAPCRSMKEALSASITKKWAPASRCWSFRAAGSTRRSPGWTPAIPSTR